MRLYRHVEVALLRAAAAPMSGTPGTWPELSDAEGCREWLEGMWSRSDLAAAVKQASPAFADFLDAVCGGSAVSPRRLHRAAVSLIRYALRATGRHTPFGLFAGVTSASVGRTAEVRWGDGHRPVACVDTVWLADVINGLEECRDLLERLDVVFTNLAVQRGGRLEAPRGPNRVSTRFTGAVAAVRDASQSPVRFGDLADKLAETFPTAAAESARGMLTQLVDQGVLITCLRAPMTVTDPLRHLLDRLDAVGAADIGDIAVVLDQLRAVREELRCHNHSATGVAEQPSVRERLTSRMRTLSGAGRAPLGVDLRLDCEVRIPEDVAHEMEWAATALMRLTRQPTGEASWRDFYTAFCDRYGTGTLVALLDVVDPDAGLGFPAGYPGSVFAVRTSGPSERDQKLLALAWTAMAEGSGEVVLDEAALRDLAVGDPTAELRVPPHVELAACIHAASTEALTRGDYLLTVTPGRSVGTFTSRFATLAAPGLGAVYANPPTSVGGALAVQLSFPPAFAHAENICRVRAYLPHVVPLGEHRSQDSVTVALDDLAVTATGHGLHLLSVSRRRVVEPQTFHGLALDKQPPPLARFLIHLSRGLTAAWHRFDWGPCAELLPYLPRVRYRRAVLAPAQWRLAGAELPTDVGEQRFGEALDRWRQRWRCPDTVELHDADRTLRLNLTVPAHAEIVRLQLNRHGHAILTETVADVTEYGWIDGHAHEVVLPLVATTRAASAPVAVAGPVVTNSGHGQLPGGPGTAWLNAKIYTNPERLDDLIAEHLPSLLAAFDTEPRYWFIRYRAPNDTDHLRLRVSTPTRDAYTAGVAAVGAWAQQLRAEAMIGRLVLDTYHPETGRYGDGRVMSAAEDVFAADSRLVAAQLRHVPEQLVPRDALVAVNMVATVRGFFADADRAMRWWSARPAPAATVVRAAQDRVVALAVTGTIHELPGWDPTLAALWHSRADALASYRCALPATTDPDAVVESLLHMHHNRLAGIDRDREAISRRLARHAALAWIARHRSTR